MTKHGELPDGRFHDPRSKKAFHYDHLRKVGNVIIVVFSCYNRMVFGWEAREKIQQSSLKDFNVVKTYV